MHRSSPYDLEPEESEPTLIERAREAIARLFRRLDGGESRQAMPLSRYRGQELPVLPYHERRRQLRARRQRSGSTTLVVVVVGVVLVVGLFFGLGWALSGISGGRAPAAATPNPAAKAAAGTPEVIQPASALPTAAAGTLASPSPSPLAGRLPPGPGTPDTTASSGERTYVVKQGDFPGLIARQFNIPVEALMRANNITDARSLKPGDRLIIPSPATPTPAG